MPELALLRHGKSEWSVPGVTDHERGLKKRGERAALTMGRFLSRAGFVPDRILCSTAVRARRTAEILVAAAGFEAPAEERADLYEANVESFLALLRRVGPDVERLLVIAHEPTLSTVASVTTGGSFLEFPTAALAWVEVAGWEDVGPGCGVLRGLYTPRALEGLGASEGD